MHYYNEKINELKNIYPDYNDFIDKYFNIYKKPLFELGLYNYNALPKDGRANSYLENYNLYLKKI